MAEVNFGSKPASITPLPPTRQQQLTNNAAYEKWRRRVQKLENCHLDSDGDSLSQSDEVNNFDVPIIVSPAPGFDLARPSSSDNASNRMLIDLPTGSVVFRDIHKNDLEGQPYLCVSANSNMADVVSVLEHEWRMPIPTIVLEILSGVKDKITFSSERQWDNMKKGFALAANKTNMWIVTHGLNSGMGKAIGEVIRTEKQRRQTITCSRHPKQGSYRPKLTLLGVVSEQNLRYAELFDGKYLITEVSSDGNSPKEKKYELNPHHSHFVLVKDGTQEERGVLKFLINFGNYLKNPPSENKTSGASSTTKELRMSHLATNRRVSHLADNKVPMIALVIGGGFSTTAMVFEHMKNQIPVVVVKGSGGAADILAFAYEEIKGNTRGAWDPDYLANFIMSEVSRKISISFEKYRDNNIARNKFRDKILECIQQSHRDERRFFNVIDIHDTKTDLRLLNEHLLQAVFNAEHREGSNTRWKYYIQKDVLLALDWNCPHIAHSGVFRGDSIGKYKIEAAIFEHALVREDREAFVELFLDQGFQLYPYLTSRRFCRLCERADNADFFHSVILENALGYLVARLDEQNFISDLNWLIYKMTKVKDFISLLELHSRTCCGNQYVNVPNSHSDNRLYVQERRAINALIVWAVLMNRPRLAKILWKRTDYPIHVALLVSMLYDGLVVYVSEKHVIKQLENLSLEFSQMAVGVLNASFETGNCRAYDVLSEEVSDFDFKTAVEMAAVAKSRQFIAHSCCQKWLTSMFHGDVRIFDLKWGICTIPVWIKIVLAAFLLFPVNVWVRFRPMASVRYAATTNIIQNGMLSTASGYEELLQESIIPESEMGSFSQSVLRRSNIDGVHHLNLGETTSRQCHEKPSDEFEAFKRRRSSTRTVTAHAIPLWRKVSILWAAPVTKFWTHQIFYIFYLSLFGVTALWPSNGNFYLDMSVWLWTVMILLESVLVTYVHHMNYSSISLGSSVIEIAFILLFLIIFLFVRILPAVEFRRVLGLHLPRLLMRGYGARVVVCLGLLYFFYRFIWIYFPISPTLGRLLFRIRLMIVRDFAHFLRLVLLFVVSSGIAIHSVIYPDYPMTWELIRRVFHKAWFALFLTPIDDLEEKPCSSDEYRGNDSDRIGPYESVSCPVTGPWPYVITIQYLVILKLVLITLLFALFSDTASKYATDADAIWRYQRYHVVLDFQARPRLPAPVNVFSFLFILFGVVKKCCCKCRVAFSKNYSGSPSYSRDESQLMDDNCSEDYYWRSVAVEYLLKEEQERQNANIILKQMDNITSITEILEYQKSSLQSLKGRINELEALVTNSRISLEEITHVINKDDAKFSVTKVHLLSRQSPYPETRVKRFPLADKYVPWEVRYCIYDPVIYTKSKARYSGYLKEFVDEDLLELQENGGCGRFHRPPVLKWNIESTSGAGFIIDRTSWMTDDDGHARIYKLDSSGMPMNPMGRTGLRGRGMLCNWGPNHTITLIITRCKSVDHYIHSATNSTRSTTAEDLRLLETVVLRRPGDSHFSLPGGFTYGEENVYNVVRKIFLPDRTSTTWDALTMQNFFADFSRVSTGDFTDVVSSQSTMDKCQMEHCMVMRGYVDDNRNTDNAWVEMEVWHFHYTADRFVDLEPNRNLRWKKVSSKLESKMIPSHAMLLKEIQQKLESCS